MIIYMTVLMYGMYVMRGVLEEKSSHVVEVIISTVKPFELMLGKILGIGAVGLTQFLIWSTLMAAISAPGMVSAMGMGDIELPTIPAQLLVFFVVYFVLGFLLYGTLYAAVGAAFDTEQEAQNFQFVVMIPLMIPAVSSAVADPLLHPDVDVPAHDPDRGARASDLRLAGADDRHDPRLGVGRGQDLPGGDPDARFEAEAERLDSVGEGSVRILNSQFLILNYGPSFRHNGLDWDH